MNKYEIVFDMLKDKVLFVFKRYKYNDNKTSISENLSFLSKTSFVIITRPFKFIIKDESNENNVDMNHFKDISNKKKSTLTFKIFKKKMIKKPDFIDIVEIDISIYHHLTRNKKNKLFFLTINEIYDILNKLSAIISQFKRDNRILINKLCLCDFETKYKKCCELYISKNAQINNVKIFIFQEIFNKLFINYHNYVNVFDKL